MNRSAHRDLAYLLLLALPSAVSATPVTNPAQQGQEAALSQALDQAMLVMFQPGEPDPDWNKGGVNLEQAIKAKPNHVALEVDKDGDRSIWFFTDKPVLTFIPADWELVTEIGQFDSSQNAALAIEISGPKDGYYSVSRSSYERVGDAFCSSAPAAVQLYKGKGAAQGSMSPDQAKSIYVGLFERAKSKMVCERYDVSGNHYRTRYYLKDGRSLPFFNDMAGPVTIEPQRPTEEMLKGE